MGFANDIFISYAQVDNQEIIESDSATRWIHTLKRNLGIQVDRILGRSGSTRIWMDIGGLPGNHLVTPTIRDAVSNTATLVVIFSRGYLHSEWCRQERELFLAAAGGVVGAAGRIFVVDCDGLSRDMWPPEFADLIGYKFWEKDSDTGLTSRQGDPKPTQEDKEYRRHLLMLCADLAKAIERLRAGNSAGDLDAGPRGVVEAGGGIHHTSDTGVVESDSPPRGNRRTVFVAEVATDREILADRDLVISFLKAEGYEILPARYYSRAPERYAEALDRDLASATLFVQLLGPVGSVWTEDLPKGYEGLQLERAQQTGKRMLRWRKRALDLTSIADLQYRSFVEAHDVMAMDLAEFNVSMLHALHLAEAREAIDVPADQDRFILVNAGSVDRALADQVGMELAQRNVGYDIFLKEQALDEVLAAYPCDGVVVVYGQCEQAWVQDRVRSLRRVSLEKRDHAPACGVVVGSPAMKDRLGIRFRGLQIMEGADAPHLRPFLEEIARRPVHG